jgi:hypothetical protein
VALRTLIVLALMARVVAAQSIATDTRESPKPVVVKPVVVEPAAPKPDPGPRWNFGLAFAGGAETIGDMTFAQIGIRISIARRIADDLAIATAGELITTNATLDDGTLIIGRTLRGTVGLDWEVTHSKKPFIPHLVLTTGVGHELTAWDRGTVSRQLVFLSAEGRSGFEFPKGGPFHGISRMGWQYGLRVTAGRPVEPIEISFACTDCKVRTMTKSNSAIDLGVLFYYGLDFGR